MYRSYHTVRQFVIWFSLLINKYFEENYSPMSFDNCKMKFIFYRVIFESIRWFQWDYILSPIGCVSRCLIQHGESLGAQKESTEGGAVRAGMNNGTERWFTPWRRTRRWRNVTSALHKSVNGFKDFPRAAVSLKVEPRNSSLPSFDQSLHHFVAALTNFPVSSRASTPGPIAKIDRLHIIGGADKSTPALFDS